MTEQAWLACTNPTPMLRFLLGTNYPRVQDVESFPACKGSDHKLRLFACACYERIRTLLPTLAFQVVQAEAPKAAYYASSNAHLAFAAIANPGAACFDKGFSGSRSFQERVQTDILRCIFGNLFHRATIAPAILGWNGGTVERIAKAIYVERAFDRLPDLACALEDAGCDDANILDHCHPGLHVRGCWVVDLILGKE